MKKIKNGFTLIELLVVVLIVGILSAVALPQYEKAVQKSRNTQLKKAILSTVQSQKIYYMQNGKFADQFSDLDIEWNLDKTAEDSNPCGYATSGTDPFRLGKNFEIILNNTSNFYSVAGVWTKGKYKCTGFRYALSTKQVGDLQNELVCLEVLEADVKNGDFCVKIENGSFLTSVGGSRKYKLP